MKNLTLLISVFVIYTVSFAQNINFAIRYSNNGYDFGNGICQLPDSSYAITGGSSSFEEGPSNAYVALLDSNGNFKWSKSYGGPEVDWAMRVKHVPNVGFFLAGVTNSFGAGGYDFMLVKTDLSGNQQWLKTYGGTNWENLYDAKLTADNGMILVGETQSNPTGNKDMLVIRTDPNGNVLWQKTFGSSLGDDIAYAVEQWTSDTLFIAGQTYIQDSLKHKASLIALDMAGDSLWSKYYGANGAATFLDIDRTGSNLHLGGTTYVTPTNSNHFNVIVKRDLTTQLYAQNVRGELNSVSLVSHYGNSSKMYQITYTNCLANIPYPGGRDIYLDRFDQNYNYGNFSRSYSNNGEDKAGELIPTSDGGAIFIASREFGIGGGNVIVVKIGQNEVAPNQAITSYNPLVFLDDVVNDTQSKIYPNPFTNQIVIDLQTEQTLNYTLFDAFGKIILQGEVAKKMELNTFFIQSGIYFLKLEGKEDSKTIKLIKR